MANADTPGYKARDMDFREVLAATRGPELKTKSTHDNHLRTVTAGSEPGLKYRVPYQPSMDGNTVELHIEQANFADNAIRYQATLTFLGSKFEGIKTAITGGR
jgi:flagellar basal-body rod protein FlgB